MKSLYITYTFSTLVALSGLALTGCSDAVITASNAGQQTAEISCSGKNVPISACYKKAEKICPAGYEIIDNKALPPGGGSPAGDIAIAIASQFPGIKKYNKGITIACKGSMNKGKMFLMQGFGV